MLARPASVKWLELGAIRAQMVASGAVYSAIRAHVVASGTVDSAIRAQMARSRATGMMS
jgi:hypothetical protein